MLKFKEDRVVKKAEATPLSFRGAPLLSFRSAPPCHSERSDEESQPAEFAIYIVLYPGSISVTTRWPHLLLSALIRS